MSGWLSDKGWAVNLGSPGPIGNVTPSTGKFTTLTATQDVVIATAGNGIDFSAVTPAPGMTSQLLDDYEEGVFSTTASVDTGSVTLQYNKLNYTKIGRAVLITGEIVVDTVSTPSGEFYITLPFVSSASASGRSGIWSSYLGVSYTFATPISGPMVGVIAQNSNTLVIRMGDNAGGTAFASFLTSGTSIDFGFSYQSN